MWTPILNGISALTRPPVWPPQSQHTKEAWACAHWAELGCRTPRGHRWQACGPTGEFCHLMADVGPTHHAGDQLVSLPVAEAVAAVREVARLHAQFWGVSKDGPAGWDAAFDGMAKHRRLLTLLGKSVAKHADNTEKQQESIAKHKPKLEPGGALAVTTTFRGAANTNPPLLRAIEQATLCCAPRARHRTVVHGDLRSANVMFPRQQSGGGSDGSAAHCVLLDWGGLMLGCGAFDVAYLLGTGMSDVDRAVHELEVLAAYGSALSAAGVDGYGGEELEADYRNCLWLTAALYALPDVYDRGTTTEENTGPSLRVRAALRANLQPVLDRGAPPAVGSGGVGLL